MKKFLVFRVNKDSWEFDSAGELAEFLEGEKYPQDFSVFVKIEGLADHNRNDKLANQLNAVAMEAILFL
jgi:hypothetical protein